MWNAAWIAANSLPFVIVDKPFSLIQYETGMNDHFGVSPVLKVMRVYANALAQQAKKTKMKRYFFKLNDSTKFGFGS